MYIKAKVTAGAKTEKLVQKGPDLFVIAVREPAERNLANGRVREVLAAHLGLPAGKIRLVSGHHSPSKIFDVGVI